MMDYHYNVWLISVHIGRIVAVASLQGFICDADTQRVAQS